MRKLNGLSCFLVVLLPVVIFLVLVTLFSCSPQPMIVKLPDSTATLTNTPLPTGTFVSFAKTLTPEPEPERMNFLVLGGDFREHRDNTGYGDKTDVMLVVSVLMSRPVVITIIQLPRNLYMSVENFPDLWAFAVYKQGGFVGLHYWFQEVFDLTVHGIVYTDMDSFVTFVDDVLGGMSVGGDWQDGEGVLEYVRNDLWGEQYDPEHRHFNVLVQMANRLMLRFSDDGLTTAKELWEFRDLVETDISDFNQFRFIIEMVFESLHRGYDVHFFQLTEPTIIYGDTPTYPGRGYIANDDLKLWMREALENIE